MNLGFSAIDFLGFFPASDIDFYQFRCDCHVCRNASGGNGGPDLGTLRASILTVMGVAVIRSELVQKLCDDHHDLTLKEEEREV